MSILAFDTSLGECSAALWRDGKVVASAYEKERNRQTQQLVPMIESVLQQADVSLRNLDLIITTSGPGSFTGIRIGLAVARSLGLASKIPVRAVSTLELLAWQACRGKPPATVVSIINAYRGELYVQTFEYKNGLTAITPPSAIAVETLEAYLPITAHLLVKDESTKPDAAALAEYAALHPLSAAEYTPQPLYIRAPDAKLPVNPLAV